MPSNLIYVAHHPSYFSKLALVFISCWPLYFYDSVLNLMPKVLREILWKVFGSYLLSRSGPFKSQAASDFYHFSTLVTLFVLLEIWVKVKIAQLTYLEDKKFKVNRKCNKRNEWKQKDSNMGWKMIKMEIMIYKKLAKTIQNCFKNPTKVKGKLPVI